MDKSDSITTTNKYKYLSFEHYERVMFFASA